MKIIKGKPNKSTFVDALGIALIKSAEERLMAPLIGNGTFMSGGAKALIAFGLPMIAGSNKWANLGATAFMVDAAEDLVNATIQSLGAGGSFGGGNSQVI